MARGSATGRTSAGEGGSTASLGGLVAVAESKRLDEMDDLRDMGRFPLPVYAGATGNVLATVALTFLVQGRYPRAGALPVWVALVLGLNLSPVFVLRRGMDPGQTRSIIEEMDFFDDQHKFTPWVYAVASANMGFWISLSWLSFSRRRSKKTLLAMLLLALFCTSFPAWVRPFKNP